MPTRWGLLAAAGIAFCCLQGAARAQGTAPGQYGRQVRTVDTNAHCIVADALALLGSGAQAAMPPTKGVKERACRRERRPREGVPVALALTRLLDVLDGRLGLGPLP